MRGQLSFLGWFIVLVSVWFTIFIDVLGQVKLPLIALDTTVLLLKVRVECGPHRTINFDILDIVVIPSFVESPIVRCLHLLVATFLLSNTFLEILLFIP